MGSVEDSTLRPEQRGLNAEVAEWLGTALPRQTTRVRISFSALSAPLA